MGGSDPAVSTLPDLHWHKVGPKVSVGPKELLTVRGKVLHGADRLEMWAAQG